MLSFFSSFGDFEYCMPSAPSLLLHLISLFCLDTQHVGSFACDELLNAHFSWNISSCVLLFVFGFSCSDLGPVQKQGMAMAFPQLIRFIGHNSDSFQIHVIDLWDKFNIIILSTHVPNSLKLSYGLIDRGSQSLSIVKPAVKKNNYIWFK